MNPQGVNGERGKAGPSEGAAIAQFWLIPAAQGC